MFRICRMQARDVHEIGDHGRRGRLSARALAVIKRGCPTASPCTTTAFIAPSTLPANAFPNHVGCVRNSMPFSVRRAIPRSLIR